MSIREGWGVTDQLGSGDSRGRPGQVVRRGARAARYRSVGAARDGAGRARPERGGQDHGGAHPDHPAAAGWRAGLGGGPRRGAGGRRGAPLHRPVRSVGGHPGGAHRPGEPGDRRASLSPGQAAGPQPRDRAAGAVRAVRCRRPGGQELLRRDAAPAGPGRQPGRPAPGAVPRRADDRPGPAVPDGDVGHHQISGRGRHHAAAHHPVPGRGRRAGGRDRGHRPGPGHRGRHRRGAEEPGRRRRAGVHGAGPDPDRRRRHRGREARGGRAAHGRRDRRGQRGRRRPGLGGARRGRARPGRRRGGDPWPGAAAALARRRIHGADRPRRRGDRPAGQAPWPPPWRGQGHDSGRREGHREGSIMTAIAVPLAEPGLLTRARWSVSDTLTITRRNLLVWLRVPAYIVFTVIQPVIFVLLFRYVFGGAIQIPGNVTYVDFLIPGIIAQTAAFATFGTAIALAQELQKGVIDRLRSMPMARSAVLAGRLTADTIRMTITILIVLGVGYAVGFRFQNGFWPAVGMVVLSIVFGVAICCIAAYTGLAIGDEESVQAFGLIWLFPLTFLSSAFVPIETMPGWLQAFANNQPVTYVVDTMRGLALGGPIWDSFWKSAVWLIGIFVVFAPLAVRAYKRAA